VVDLDTGTDDLLAAIDDGIAVLTLNRPERRNAMSLPMLLALERLLADLETDDSVGAIVLTGAGGAFCSGGDVTAMAGSKSMFSTDTAGDEHVLRQRNSQRGTAVRLWSMVKPTIAMIPGPAVGAGLSLALACDLRYAADTAVFVTGFASAGLSGDYAGSWFLTRLVGSAKAKELYYFSERLDAAAAERLGLVNAVFSAESLREEALARALRLASGPRVALRYMKENLNRAVLGDLAECSDVEVLHHVRTRKTDDHREAMRAFADKRPPVFRGR
jgi:2-(1,2-epoxy-1,2-dihydrophenyl)acetyl-CoA isomerase